MKYIIKNKVILMIIIFALSIGTVCFANSGDNNNVVDFYGITSQISIMGEDEYIVALTNDEDEENVYRFAQGHGLEVAQELDERDIYGYFAMVTFNDDDEIIDIDLIARADEEEGASNCNIGTDEIEVQYGSNEDKKYYYRYAEGVSYDRQENVITIDDGSIQVGDSAIIFNLVYYEDNNTYDCYCLSEASKFNYISDAKTIVVIDEYGVLKYIVLFKPIERIQVAVVEDVEVNEINSNYYDIELVFDGDSRYVLDKNNYGLKENDVIVYTTRLRDYIDELNVISKITNIPKDNFDYVARAYGKNVKLGNGTEIKYGSSNMIDHYQDFIVVLIETDEDGIVDSVTSETFEDIEFYDFDRIEIDEDNGVFYIIRGLEEKGETEDLYFELCGVSSLVKKVSSSKYKINLDNGYSEYEYTFASGNGLAIAKDLYGQDILGCIALVVYNEDDKIVDMNLLAKADLNGGTSNNYVGTEKVSVNYEYGGDSNYIYKFSDNVNYTVSNDGLLVDNNEIMVLNNNTETILLEYDKGDEEFTYSFNHNLDLNVINKLKNTPAIIFWEENNNQLMVDYIILFSEPEIKVAKVVKVTNNMINNNIINIKLEDENGDTENVIDKENMGLAVNDVVVYTTKAVDDEYEMTVFSKLTRITDDNFTYIAEAIGKKVLLSDGTVINYGSDEMQNSMKDYLVVLIETDEDGNVDSVYSNTFYYISFSDYDRIEIDEANEVFYIIRGLNEKEESGDATLIGDVDGNGELDIIDVRLLLQRIINNSFTEAEKPVLDFDEDGEVSIIDVRLLLQTIINQ